MGKQPGSLVTRLVLTTAVMLTVALGLAGFSLDRGFRESARSALEDRLEAHLYGLMGLVEVAPDGGVSVPDSLAEPRLAVTLGPWPGPGATGRGSATGTQAVWS